MSNLTTTYFILDVELGFVFDEKSDHVGMPSIGSPDECRLSGLSEQRSNRGQVGSLVWSEMSRWVKAQSHFVLNEQPDHHLLYLGCRAGLCFR